MATTPIFPASIKNWALKVQNSDGTNELTFITAGTNGSQIIAINASSTNPGTVTFDVSLKNGATSYLIARFDVLGNSGNANTTYPVDVLRLPNFWFVPYNAEGNRILYLQSGWMLTVKPTSAVTNPYAIDFVAVGGDY